MVLNSKYNERFDSIEYATKNKLIVCFYDLHCSYLCMVVRKNKQNVNVKVTRKLKINNCEVCYKNKLIVCFNSSRCLIFCTEFEKCGKLIN